MPYNVKLAPSASTTGMGANLFTDESGASIRVWAPNASHVVVKVKPDAPVDYENVPLAQDSANSEYYSADITGILPGHQYRFLITNNHVGQNNPGGLFERIDPYARAIANPDAASPGIVINPVDAFVPFRPPSPENFIIYQMHIGSFAGLNDAFAHSIVNQTATFRTIADTVNVDLVNRKLDYIRSMNFNAIQFLPTTSYAAHRDEGYGPKNFFAPEFDYGRPEDLRFLVDQCHQKGLAVIFDVVYNHVISDDADDRLLQFDGNSESGGRGIYFSTFYNFGPVPNFDKPAVRDFFVDNARMCFREYKVDGLRFDSAHAIRGQDGSPQALQDIVGRIAQEFPNKLLIAEYDNPAYGLQTFRFGAAWQMGIADDFLRIMNNSSINELKSLIEYWGYPHAFSPVRFLLGSHDQIYTSYHSDGMGNITTEKSSNRYFVEKVGGVIVGRDDWHARAKARMGWALNVSMPGTPMLFMGTEVHHYGYWNPDIDVYGDHRFNWALASDLLGEQMRNLVGDINQVRWNNAALSSDGNLLFPHLDPQNHVLAFKRSNNEGNVVLTVVNMSENQWDGATYGVNVGGNNSNWEEIFNSQSPQYGGWNDSGNYLANLSVGPNGQFFIRLPKWSVLVFRQR